MSEIALYNLFRRIPDATDSEIKKVVTNLVHSKDVATKADIAEAKAEITDIKVDVTELKADMNAMKWMLGFLVTVNVAVIVLAVGLMIKYL